MASKQLVIQVDPDLLARLKAKKKETGCPVTEMVRRALMVYLSLTPAPIEKRAEQQPVFFPGK